MYLRLFLLKTDVLHSTDLQSFLLGTVITLHGNACPSLGYTIHMGKTKISYNLLEAQSPLPHLSNQQYMLLVFFVIFCFQQTLNVGVGFFYVNYMNKFYWRVLGPLCSKMNRWRVFTLQGHVEAEDLLSNHRCRCSTLNHQPLKSTSQFSTTSSYKMTLSHSFLEGSTAEAMIQEGEHWFWGSPTPNQVAQLSLSDLVWLNVTARWKIFVFPLTCPSFWWSLFRFQL
jgi:hypothetical protein